MQIRKLDRARLQHENGLKAQRLFPWPILQAPFEGSWCVISPGTASTPHEHHEYEIFIALSGEAVIDHDGERFPFSTGDIAHFLPGERHSVINDGDTDFEMYSIWWDVSMAQWFANCHETKADVMKDALVKTARAKAAVLKDVGVKDAGVKAAGAKAAVAK